MWNLLIKRKTTLTDGWCASQNVSTFDQLRQWPSLKDNVSLSQIKGMVPQVTQVDLLSLVLFVQIHLAVQKKNNQILVVL